MRRDRSTKKTRSDADKCTLAKWVKEVHVRNSAYAGPDPSLSACLNIYPVGLYAFLHYQIKALVRPLGFYRLIETPKTVEIEALPVNNFRCGMKLHQSADLLSILDI
jgi:hypothetical protein